MHKHYVDYLTAVVTKIDQEQEWTWQLVLKTVVELMQLAKTFRDLTKPERKTLVLHVLVKVIKNNTGINKDILELCQNKLPDLIDTLVQVSKMKNPFVDGKIRNCCGV